MSYKLLLLIALAIGGLAVAGVVAIAVYLDFAEGITQPNNTAVTVHAPAARVNFEPRRLRDATDLTPPALLEYPGSLFHCRALAPDLFCCLAERGHLFLFSSGQLLADIDLGGKDLYAFDASLTTKRFVGGGSKGELVLVDAETQVVCARAQERDKRVAGVCFVEGGHAVLVVSADGVVSKYDADLKARREILDLAKVLGPALRPCNVRCNGSNLVTLCMSDYGYAVLRYREGVLEVTHKEYVADRNEEQICSVVPSPDGARFLVARGHGRLQEWDAKTFQPTRSFDCKETCRLVHYSPDGRYLCACYYRAAEVFRTADGVRILNLRCARGCGDVSFSPDGKKLLLATHYDSDDNFLEAQCCLFDVP